MVTNTDKQTGDELRQKIRCLDCYSMMGNHMAMKKHISVHHVYLFDKEYTSAAESGSETRSEDAVDDTLQCQVCHLWFQGEFGLANHYSREHFDRIRGVGGGVGGEGESTDSHEDRDLADGAMVGEGDDPDSQTTTTTTTKAKSAIKVGGEIMAIRNLGDDMDDDMKEEEEKVIKDDNEDTDKPKDNSEESSDADGQENLQASSSTTNASDSTPRRSSRRHALKNMNPQHVPPEDQQQRAPSCIEINKTSRETISTSDDPRKQDGNESGSALKNGDVDDATEKKGRVSSKGDSEEVDFGDDDDDDNHDNGRGKDAEGEEKGEVKEEGGRNAGNLTATTTNVKKEEESVEISPARKGGLQCPLCPTSCNYRSLLLNHIKKFHPGRWTL